MKPSDLIISESRAPKFNQPPQVDESCLNIGDCQFPYHDAVFLNRVVRVALAFGVEAINIVGDAFDFNALSIFISQVSKDINDELDQDEFYFKQLVAPFKKKLLVLGNHEYRLSRMLNQYINADRVRKLLGLDDSVVTTNYYYVFIGKDWQASHPDNSSIIPGQVPKMLSQKYRRNTISFHGHLTGAAQSIDGLLYSIDAGVTCDPLRLEHTQVRQNTRPVATQGAVILLKDDYGKYHPRILNKFTDWDFEIKTGELWRNKQKRKHKK